MPDRDLWTVVGGRGTLRLTGNVERSWNVTRGDVFVLDGTLPVIATHDPADPLVVVAVHFEGGPPLPVHTNVVPVEFLAGLLDRCLRARLRGNTDAAVRWLEAALDELDDSQELRTGAEDSLQVLLDRIRERPGDDWRVGTIADRLGVTPQHLGRLFRGATGRSPKEYVLEARTQAARAYLTESSLPVKRIAAELGFHDEFHFSRQFRSRTGVTPSAWRAHATRRPASSEPPSRLHPG
jgi:AraC-like DNA-binding protein